MPAINILDPQRAKDVNESVPHSQIKIATFNLFNYLEPPFAYYQFERIYSIEQWHKKQRWISDYLHEFKPDVIGFQEVFSCDSLCELLFGHGYQHFAVVDQAEISDDFICSKPVVAIASRYPIKSVDAVTADRELAVAIGLKSDFSFSRKVLRATVDLPHVGECDCYVAHFKSKRSMLEFANNDNFSSEKKIVEMLKAQIAGGWGSTIQRGSEAALLMVSMINRREKTGRPMILMGDFNNSLADGILSQLLTDSLHFACADNCDVLLAKYLLKDSWDLYQSTDNDTQHVPRKPTHYFGATSSVLDYILLSCEFDACCQSSTFEVSEYHTYDRHLINPIFSRDAESTDHGIVLITLTLRA